METLREFLLVEQASAVAEHHIRESADKWLIRRFCEAAQTIELHSIGCTVTLADAFERVKAR
jgi:hypothetical protein